MLGYQYLLEIDALDASFSPVSLGFCCAPGHSGGFHTLTPAMTSWQPRIVDPGLIQSSLFSGAKLTGTSSSSVGDIILGNFPPTVNGAGPTDILKSYHFYGRQVRLYVGAIGAATSAFTQHYTAVIENYIINWDTINFTLKGIQTKLDVSFYEARDAFRLANTLSVDTKYLGTNALPAGTEGAIEFKDKLKPVLFGRVYNAPLECCNTAQLAYCISYLTFADPISRIFSEIKIKDKGVELRCSAEYTNVTLLYAANITPGTYAISLDGYIRLGSNPQGTVTFSGCSLGDSAISSPVNLITDVLTLAGFASMIDPISFQAFQGTSMANAIDRRERGVYITSHTNVSAILDLLLAPLGYWYITPSGTIALGRVKDPSLMTASFILSTNTNVGKFVCRRTEDTVGGIPPSMVTVKYKMNHNPTKDVAGVVPVDEQTALANQWVQLSSSKSLHPHPLSKEMIIETRMSNVDTTLVTELGNLFTVKRDVVDVDIIITDKPSSIFLSAAVVPIGSCVTFSVPTRTNLGFSSKKMILVNKTVNYVSETVSWSLWG